MFDELRKKLSGALKNFIKTETDDAQAEERQEAPKITKEKEWYGPESKRSMDVEKSVKLSFGTKVKSVLFGSVTLKDTDIDNFLESLKLTMLESDVSYKTTEELIEDLRAQLKDRKVDSKEIENEITNVVRNSLLKVLQSEKRLELTSAIKEKLSSGSAPVKILFLGPNGTGKTTTIAKLAYMFKNIGMNSVLSASDTFRAAAIEQIDYHAQKLEVPIIKSGYGTDPASVAFDAIAYAKAHGVALVLIDSAGRQETNRNLINEIEKMVRVAKPDIIIFVGESTAGNVIAEQVKEFGRYMKIDGVILTKLDLDAKGGSALSIASTTGVPVLYFGTGESYDALVPFSADFIVNALLPNN